MPSSLTTREREETRLREELKGYGVAPENVRFFGQPNPNPDLQDYLTLNALRRDNRAAPDGVAEHQGRPVLYFVDDDRLLRQSPSQDLYSTEPAQLPAIFRQLACRGERVYLARVQLGKVFVAPVSLSERQPEWREYTPNSTEGRCLFSRLAFGITEGEDFAAGDAVFSRLFKLLKHVANKIAKHEEFRGDALSLVGRALFFRFLLDRSVLENYPATRIAPGAFDWSDCFSNPKNAADTCQWLDRTFNGDFLALTRNGDQAFFERLGELTNGGIFRDLSAVVRGHEPSGDDYQPVLSWKWQQFDFAHIPVGLLSQVYEAFAWAWTPKEAKTTSQRFTPRNVAVTLLDEVFHKLPNVSQCRVLDPACGAGVFLVLAFRRLYLEMWRKAKRKARPGTADIRNILDDQLVGLDISDAALRLAALSLYLTAIELDPEPKPPDKLKFKNLYNRVLFNVREGNARNNGAALGSLGDHLGDQFDGKFDVVISNPPWTSVHKKLGKRLGNVCRAVIARSDPEAARAYRLYDNNPDLPFLWKATQWCKRDGRIAMALPARILLKTKAGPVAARKTLFDLIQVDGIINGSNLSDTRVWPQMNQPWILLFAHNRRSPDGHLTHFIALPLDATLNKVGQFRIDSDSSRLIDTATAHAKPWLWKALSVGTMLDVEIIEKMRAAGGVPLNQYWEQTVGRFRNGKGYQVVETQKGLKRCRFLKGLPDLTATDMFRFVVDPQQLPPFTRNRLWRPRKSTIYDPPLVLIQQSPGEDRTKGRALLAFERLAYSRTFNGYSGCDYANGELLVRYLHLFIHSDVWIYYLLATSPEFGAERRTSRKADLDNFPIVPLESLGEEQTAVIRRLSAELVSSRSPPWNEIDAFFAKLYGLREYDLQVVRDTLSVSLPYDSARARACALPARAERAAFRDAVKKALSPAVAAVNGSLNVELWNPPTPEGRVASPFGVLILTTGNRGPADIASIADGAIGPILEYADETGATQVIQPDPAGLVVGVYNQYRYWTLSRARLLSGDILRLHLDVITG